MSPSQASETCASASSATSPCVRIYEPGCRSVKAEIVTLTTTDSARFDSRSNSGRSRAGSNGDAGPAVSASAGNHRYQTRVCGVRNAGSEIYRFVQNHDNEGDHRVPAG